MLFGNAGRADPQISPDGHADRTSHPCRRCAERVDPPRKVTDDRAVTGKKHRGIRNCQTDIASKQRIRASCLSRPALIAIPNLSAVSSALHCGARRRAIPFGIALLRSCSSRSAVTESNWLEDKLPGHLDD